MATVAPTAGPAHQPNRTQSSTSRDAARTGEAQNRDRLQHRSRALDVKARACQDRGWLGEMDWCKMHAASF